MDIGIFVRAIDFFKYIIESRYDSYSGTHRNLCKAMNGLLYEYCNVGLTKLFEGACPNCL